MMTDDDRPAFAAQMTRLAEIFRQEISETLAEEYFEALSRYDMSDVRFAASWARDSLAFLPKPAELIDLVRARRRQLADEREATALPSGPLTEEQILVGRRALADLEELVGRVMAEKAVPRLAEPVHQPTAADLEAHERRKREVLDQALAAGVLTVEDIQEARARRRAKG